MQTRSSENIPIIDVSQHQGTIDWMAVAASGIKGAMVKASEGIGYTDPLFRRNAVGAPAAGLAVGFYHYARPETGNTASQEAEAFIEAIGTLPSIFPHALDLEDDKDHRVSALGSKYLTEWAFEWLETVERRTGRRAMIYTGASFARTFLGAKLARWPLWVAHYGTDTPMSNGTWDRWVIFQYSDSGKVNGISGNVDMNEMDLEFWNEITAPKEETQEDEDNMPMKLEQWQWDMLYQVLGKAYNADQLNWDWLQKIVDKTLTAAELAFLNTVLDGRIDRKIEV